MSETGFIPIVRRWWWLLALGAASAAVAAHVLAKHERPTYASTATLLVGPLNTDYTTVRAAGELGRTYAEIAKSLPLLRRVAVNIGGHVTAAQLASDVSATSNDVTRLVTVQAKNANPDRAAMIANALGAQLVDLSSTVPPAESEAIRAFMAQTEINHLPAAEQDRIHAAALRTFGAGLTGRLRLMDPAVPSGHPVAPKITLLTVLGGLAGLALAGIVVLVMSSGGRRRESGSVAALDGVPFFGTCGRPATQSYRLLAAKIGFLDGRPPIRNLVVFGADGERASGDVAANLAAVLADGDSRVVLVDAASGTVTKLLGLNGRPGYSELLRNGNADGNGMLDEVRVRHRERLEVVPLGEGAAPPLLEVERAGRVLEALGREADVVILSAPPIDRSPAGLVWARVADGTVVVAEGESREAVEEAASSLALVGAKLVGTVAARGRRLRRLRIPSAHAKEKEAA